MKKSEFAKHGWKHGDNVILKDGLCYLVNTVGLTSACVGCATLDGTEWHKCDEIQTHIRQDGSEAVPESSGSDKAYIAGLESEIKRLTKENKSLRTNLAALTRYPNIQKMADKLCNLLGNATSLESNITAYLDQLTLAHKRMNDIDAILKEVMVTDE